MLKSSGWRSTQKCDSSSGNKRPSAASQESPRDAVVTSNGRRYSSVQRSACKRLKKRGDQAEARSPLRREAAERVLPSAEFVRQAPTRVICLQCARWWSFFMMLFHPRWTLGGWGGALSSRAPDKLAPEAISVGYRLLYLSRETGVNLCCDLYSALPAALTWR